MSLLFWQSVVLTIVAIFFLFLKYGSQYSLLDKIKNITPSGRRKLQAELNSVLLEHSAYYQALTAAGKEKFIQRTLSFIRSKNFIGMNGMKVTGDMEIRIAATAVQVTFGFDVFSFSHFHTIKLFSESFYSRIHNDYLKGGASTGGVIYFSWKDFVEGFDDPSDKYNLGLHEMAHALRIQLLHGSDFDEKFANYANEWLKIARPEFEAMNNGSGSFLRSYAAVNMEEFFAVCIEHFFEVSGEFKKQLPDIYNHLCFLLNQDPSETTDDFRLSSSFAIEINSNQERLPVPLKLRKNYEYDTWHWSFNFIVAGIFIAFPVVVLLYGKVLFKPIHVAMILAFSVALFSGFGKYFISKGIYLFRHLVLFSTMGSGMILCCIFLLINLLFKTGYSTECYKITNYTYTRSVNQKPDIYTVILQGNKFKSYPELRSFSEVNSANEVPFADSVQFLFSKGIFGLQNFESKNLIFNALPKKVQAK